ncbi:MAG: hypothetical protein HY784_16580 [Chloroflexi bacterium]|nr:hypothetical protein [Chloroflexota bacterium]
MRHLSRWITIMVGVAILAALFVAPAPAVALRAQADSPFGESPDIPWPVALDGWFNWDCCGGGDAIWYLNRNGTFDDNYGNTGRWTYARETNTLTMQYQAGCYPTYTGVRSGINFSGRMICTDGSGEGGSWGATYVRGSQAETRPGAASPAGP